MYDYYDIVSSRTSFVLQLLPREFHLHRYSRGLDRNNFIPETFYILYTNISTEFELCLKINCASIMLKMSKYTLTVSGSIKLNSTFQQKFY